MHCKYREIFVLPMVERRKDPNDRLFPRVSPLFARSRRRAFSLNECGKRVCTQSSSAANTLRHRAAGRDSNNESGVYSGFRANSRIAQVTRKPPQFASGSLSLLCAYVRGQDPPHKYIRFIFFEIHERRCPPAQPDEILNRYFGP